MRNQCEATIAKERCMPSENEIYDAISLFGIRVLFESDSQAMLDVAMALYSSRQEEDEQPSCSIYIVLRHYGVNRASGERQDVHGNVLVLEAGGITFRADGAAGRGSCDIPEGADGALAREM